jgi:hypothetical protein
MELYDANKDGKVTFDEYENLLVKTFEKKVYYKLIFYLYYINLF